MYAVIQGKERRCDVMPLTVRLGNGAGKRSRTPDLRITNALLYQLSYAGFKRGVASIANRFQGARWV